MSQLKETIEEHAGDPPPSKPPPPITADRLGAVGDVVLVLGMALSALYLSLITVLGIGCMITLAL